MDDSTPDDGGTATGSGEVDLAAELPVTGGAPRWRQPKALVLWGVLAVLALGASLVAVRSDGRPPRLPIALGSATAEKRAAPAAAQVAVAPNPGAPSSDLVLAPHPTYVAGSDLPALGGTGTAYRLRSDISSAQVAALAHALGLAGSPTKAEGGWHLEAGGRRLDVSTGDAGSWWFGSTPPDAGSSPGAAASSGSSGSGSGSAAVSSPPVPVASGSSTSPSPGANVSSPPVSSGIAPYDPRSAGPPTELDPQPLAPDLPSREQARKIALDLLAATGMDVTGADVTVDGPGDAWYVSVEPKVDGLTVSGLTASVAVGSKGVVSNASGFLDHPTKVGDYPVLDTRAVIDRLNARGIGGPVLDDRVTTQTAVANPDASIDAEGAPGSGSASSPCDLPVPPIRDVPVSSACQVDPAGPQAPPGQPVPPQRIVLHSADRVVLLVPASDSSSDSYLVPGYRFHGDRDVVVEGIAVDDASLVPPTTSPAPLATTTVVGTAVPPDVPVPQVAPAVGDAKPRQ